MTQTLNVEFFWYLAAFSPVFLAQVEQQANVPVPVPMTAQSPQTRINLDRKCAATSLYIVLRLEGHQVNYENIFGRFENDPDTMSPTPARGFCKAARDFGVELDVIQLSDRDLDRIKGPFIVYKNPCAGVEKAPGHYVAARVVDGGSKVQLINPPHDPLLFSRDDLFHKANSWQRIALVPRSSYGPVRGDWMILIPAGLIGVGSAWFLLFSARKYKV